MKNMKFKQWVLVATILLVVTAITPVFTAVVSAKSEAPKSFNATNEKYLDGYIAGYHFGKKKTTSGKYVYCNDIHKGTPYGEKMTLIGEAPAGIAYILENGYPSKSLTGNSDYDYYITQAAIWWYIDDTTGSSNLSSAFRTGSDPYNLRKYVTKLVTGAKKVKSYEKASFTLVNSDKKMTLSGDGKYYESKAISVKASNIKGNYTVSMSGVPSGAKIVNASSGASQKSFTTKQKFKIRIPVASVKTTKINITVTAKATGSINKAYEYKSSDASVQNVYGSALYPDTNSLSDKTTLSLSPSKVTIEKVDAKTGAALAGAKFVLLNSSGATVASFTSTTSPYVIQNLPNGTYTLKETSAPEGYKIAQETTKIVITDTNRNITVKVDNQPDDNSYIKIIKIDAKTKETLAGASFVLMDSTGKTISTWTSTTSAHVIKDLPNGTYIVKETKAPEGYLLSSESKTAVIDDTHRDITITMENEPESNLVKVLKIDKTSGETLAGATFELTDSTGKVITSWTSTVNAHVIKNLPNGTYFLKETKAPEGYKMLQESIKFTIDDNNRELTIKMENESITKLVNILKIDKPTGQPLAGAHLIVKNPLGEVVADFITDGTPYTLTGLSNGEYTVEEESAPEGYIKSDEIYRFTISDDTPTAKVVFENYPEVYVPNTASNHSIFPPLIGTMILLSGIGYCYYNGKKQKQQ